jgi:hypothetical protein
LQNQEHTTQTSTTANSPAGVHAIEVSSQRAAGPILFSFLCHSPRLPKMEKPQSKVLLLGDPGVGKVLFHPSPSVPYLLPRLTRSGPAVQTSLAIQLAHNAFLGTTRNHLTIY